MNICSRECLVLVRKSDRMRYKVYGKLAFVCSLDCITILIGFIVSLFATYNNNFYNKSFSFLNNKMSQWGQQLIHFWCHLSVLNSRSRAKKISPRCSEWMKQFDRISSPMALAFVRKLMNCLMVLASLASLNQNSNSRHQFEDQSMSLGLTRLFMK